MVGNGRGGVSGTYTGYTPNGNPAVSLMVVVVVVVVMVKCAVAFSPILIVLVSVHLLLFRRCGVRESVYSVRSPSLPKTSLLTKTTAGVGRL